MAIVDSRYIHRRVSASRELTAASAVSTYETGDTDDQIFTLTNTSSGNSTVTTDSTDLAGTDHQVVESHSSATVTNYNEYDGGYYSVTSDGGSSNNYYETQANDYTLSGSATADTHSSETGDSQGGDYSLHTSSNDDSDYTRWGTDYSGNAFTIEQSDGSGGSVDTTGNHIDGTFNASASGTDVQTTDETITGTGVNSSLHQVLISDSDLNNIGNEINGDFDSWDNQINTTQVTQSGHNAGGTYWMSESLSDSPFIHKFGNSVDGTQEISQSGSEQYSLSQTNTSGSDTYTLSGTGTDPYTLTGNDNANDGDSHRVKTGTDDYTLTQTGSTASKMYTLTLTGSDGYTATSDINSQSGAFSMTTTGSGTYGKIEDGTDNSSGSAVPISTNTTGSTDFTVTEKGNSRDADLVLTTTGVTRYDGLEAFNNTSDGGNGTAGFGDFSPVGAPVLVGRMSVPAGIFSSIGDDRYDYCFAGDTLVMMADGTTKLITEVKVGDMVLAVHDTDSQAEPQAYRVARVFHNAPARLFRVVGGGKSIRCTSNHPFYEKTKGWTGAAALEAGDMLRTLNGCWSQVDAISDTGETEPVFNLEIERAHTYFVRSTGGGTPILVHNESVEESEAWHHLLSKKVFDPANKDSILNQRHMKLAEGVDIHSKDYGWMIAKGPHNKKLHANDNELGMTWQKAQQDYLNTLPEGSTLTKEMLDEHILGMKKSYGIIDKDTAVVLKGMGREANEAWSGLNAYYKKLGSRLLVDGVVRGSGRALKILVHGGKVLAVYAAFQGFKEARADGASTSAAIFVAVGEGVNPLPWSSVEIKEALGERADMIKEWAVEAHSNLEDNMVNFVPNMAQSEDQILQMELDVLRRHGKPGTDLVAKYQNAIDAINASSLSDDQKEENLTVLRRRLNYLKDRLGVQ